MAHTLRILTWNIAECIPSFSAPSDWPPERSRERIIDLILSFDADVLCLQEMPEASFTVGSAYVLLGAVASHCGFVGLFVRHSLQPRVSGVELVGPAVCARISFVGAAPLAIASFHLAPFDGLVHAKKRLRQFEALRRVCAGRAVLAGDANMQEVELHRLPEDVIDVAPSAAEAGAASNEDPATPTTAVSHPGVLNAESPSTPAPRDSAARTAEPPSSCTPVQPTGASVQRGRTPTWDSITNRYHRPHADHAGFTACFDRVLVSDCCPGECRVVCNAPASNCAGHFLSDHFGLLAVCIV